MKPFYEHDGITIYHDDCRAVLPALPGAFAVITDPVWPNSSDELTGHERPSELFSEAAAHFSRLATRAVVHLGFGSDPRILAGLPPSLPFFRVCWLEYAVPSFVGRALGGADVAYAFGEPPPSKPGRHLIPGRMKLPAQPGKSCKGHPCARNLDVVRWLVNWFAGTDVVLDPFCGSGTTLRAAKDCGRKAVGIEIEERYCEIAARRLEQSVFDFEQVVVATRDREAV